MADAVSPKGREIVKVTGDHDLIRRRGTSIKELGSHMLESADTLEALATGADASAGESIEKLRSEVGEVYLELRLAGQRYQPSGKALISYADDLSDVQRRMAVTVPSCLEAWSSYQAAEATSNQKRQDAWQAQSNADHSDDEANDQTLQNAANRAQQAADAAETAAANAHETFLGLARTFDEQYDDWSVAFNAAAESLEDATCGGVSDRPGDYFNRVLDYVLVGLQIAGAVLAILAFIIGGPIIALLGAIVAIATLALTIVAMIRQRPGVDGWDLAFAIVGVIPFGALTKFSGGAKAGFVAMFDDMVGGLGTAASRTNLSFAFKNFGSTWQTARVFGASGWGSIVTAFRGGDSMADIAARIAGIGFGDELLRLGTDGWSTAGQIFGHYGWVINTPGAVVMLGFDLFDPNRSKIDTWATQFDDC